MQGVGGTYPEWDYIPETSVGAGGASGTIGAGEEGLNCFSGFKAFHRPTDTVLACWSSLHVGSL